MRALAPGVWQLRGLPPNAINVYLVGDVLVDAGTPAARRRILRELRDVAVATHVVTHAHPDHFGSSHAVCEALDLPLWTGEHDAEAIETATPVPSDTRGGPLPRQGQDAARAPGRAAAARGRRGRRLRGARRARPLAGAHRAVARARPHAHRRRRLLQPPAARRAAGLPDRRPAAATARRCAASRELRPALALFGHGPPLRDPAASARSAAETRLKISAVLPTTRADDGFP